MKPTHLTVTCDNGHMDQIQFKGEPVSEEWAKNLAGLLDGTSLMYLFPPGPESTIGKCAACGAKISASVQGYEESP